MSYIEINAMRVAEACDKYRAFAREWKDLRIRAEAHKRISRAVWWPKTMVKALSEVEADAYFMDGLNHASERFDTLVEGVAALASAVGLKGTVHLDEEAAYVLRKFL